MKGRPVSPSSPKESAADGRFATVCQLPPLPRLDQVPSRERAAHLWIDMRERWGSGQLIRAEDYLADSAFPADDELILDLIYGEFALREQYGERPRLEEYARRFPRYSDRLARQFAVHQDLQGSTVLAGNRSPRPQPASGRDGPDVTELPGHIGKYRVVALLGAGSQATVYRAYHPTLDREVVIKLGRVAVGDVSAARDRLQAEARILAGLEHPGLARVLDLDLHHGVPFLVMESVAGLSLEQAAEHTCLAPEQAASLVAQAARAVAVAHRRGVVHQDIKPANILLDEDGKARLIDFGLARVRQIWAQGRA